MSEIERTKNEYIPFNSLYNFMNLLKHLIDEEIYNDLCIINKNRTNNTNFDNFMKLRILKYKDMNMHLLVRHFGDPLTTFDNENNFTCSLGEFIKALYPDDNANSNNLNFISHTWSGNTENFFDLIKKFLEKYKDGTEKESLWICTFCIDQWKAGEVLKVDDINKTPFYKGLNIANQYIGIIGKELKDTFDNLCKFMTRPWCIVELYIALIWGISIQLIGEFTETSNKICNKIVDDINNIAQLSTGDEKKIVTEYLQNDKIIKTYMEHFSKYSIEDLVEARRYVFRKKNINKVIITNLADNIPVPT